MRKIITIFLLFPTLLIGQTLTCLQNTENNNIKICDKTSYSQYNDKTKSYYRTIDLTKEDLSKLDSIQICCDTLTISSFMVTSGDCGSDFLLISYSSKFSQTMKDLLIKDCLKRVWIEEIKAISKSGQIYSIKSVKIKLK